jgi:hypothetical protein
MSSHTSTATDMNGSRFERSTAGENSCCCLYAQLREDWLKKRRPRTRPRRNVYLWRRRRRLWSRRTDHRLVQNNVAESSQQSFLHVDSDDAGRPRPPSVSRHAADDEKSDGAEVARTALRQPEVEIKAGSRGPSSLLTNARLFILMPFFYNDSYSRYFFIEKGTPELR